MTTTKQYEAEYADRVARGANSLDLHHTTNGYSWVDAIKTSKLDLSETYSCVLGQLHGQYSTGLRKEYGGNFSFRTAVRYGFHLSKRNDDRGNRWRALTNLWKAEIRKRRAARRV